MCSRVLSVDPGTRNLAICCLAYDTAAQPDLPDSMEQFLSRLSLERLGFVDLRTNHVESAAFAFRTCISPGHELEWVCSEYDPANTDVVIEQQGSPTSPITFLCHALQGVFLGMQARGFAGQRGSITTRYPAANKFRGDWCRVQSRDGQRIEIAEPTTRHGGDRFATGDPVKNAAVEACERIMSWFRRDEAFDAALARVRSEKRQHDLADCVLQATSYLFKVHVQKHGSLTQRARPSLTLPITGEPCETTEQMLGEPRGSRKRATQTTAVRSKRAKKAAIVPAPVDPTAGIDFS